MTNCMVFLLALLVSLSFSSMVNDLLSLPISVTLPDTDFPCSVCFFGCDSCESDRAPAEAPKSNRPATETQVKNFRNIGIHLLQNGRDCDRLARSLPCAHNNRASTSCGKETCCIEDRCSLKRRWLSH